MDHLDCAPTPPSLRPRRRAGRPRKGEGPRLNYVELDQILVFGETGGEAGRGISYPSYRELAARYCVAVSVIGEYARKHKCMKRRKQAAARVQSLVDKKRIQIRAQDVVLGRDDLASSAADLFHGARRSVLEERTASTPAVVR